MNDGSLPEQLQQHLNSLVPARPPAMLAMEAYAERTNFPIIGPASGYFCYQMTRLINAKRVFEMGSGFGYSTAWFAQAVKENGGGTVYHVVWDEELTRQARRHLSVLGFDSLITYITGEAIQTLRETEGPFDLIFNDIDKAAYVDSLAVIKEKLRPGGLLIVDNMLWHGRIFDAIDQSDSTQAIRELTRLLTSDSSWITSLVPIRDGLIVAMRK